MAEAASDDKGKGKGEGEGKEEAEAEAGDTQLLVKWAGLDYDECTWEWRADLLALDGYEQALEELRLRQQGPASRKSRTKGRRVKGDFAEAKEQPE